MSSPLPDLFSKRLLVVSGKGGVGKTVITSALALIASGQGKNVLLVKMDDQGRTAQLFGVPGLDDRVTPLRENVSALNLDPVTIVADYFVRQLKVRTLVRHIMASKLFQNWFRVSPAIKEMICLGKVWSLVDESSWWRGRPVWDLVIFDAPATGHGLGLLRLPEQASKLLIGPMRTNALAVQALLEDKAQTSLVLVAIPEDMPVNETAHFYDEARRHLDLDLACVILNQSAPRRFAGPAHEVNDAVAAALEGAPTQAALGALLGTDTGSVERDALQPSVLSAVARTRTRRALTERYEKLLREKVPLPLVEVPYVFAESFGFPELEQVAVSLGRALEGRDRAESAGEDRQGGAA